MTRVSRRDFVRLGGAGAVAAPLVLYPIPVSTAVTTAQQVVDRIRTSLGVEWQADTADTFKAGDPSTVVTGIVTTSLATIDVMRRAAKAGANMIITSGPTFYSRADRPSPPANRGGRRGTAAPPSPDPIFAAKNEFIKANNLVVWRFSDHWRLRAPNPFIAGLIDTLGWTKYGANDASRAVVTVPAVTLARLVEDVNRKLNARGGMRVIGNRQMRVRRIGFLPGSVPIQTTLKLLPEVDALIAGEIREWESSEYARDVVAEGLPRALILVGRTLSEESGMKVCAQWLQTLVPDLRCRWMPVGDPYWRPA